VTVQKGFGACVGGGGHLSLTARKQGATIQVRAESERYRRRGGGGLYTRGSLLTASNRTYKTRWVYPSGSPEMHILGFRARCRVRLN